jgi:hypothetical protein
MASLADILRGALDKAKDGLPAERLDAIVAGYGPSPDARMLQSDINRGVLPGARTPDSEGMSPADLAQIDRYAWGEQAGLGGVPVAVAYEALKALGSAPGLTGVSGALFGDTGREFFQNDASTSPASLGNVVSYVQGALGPRARSSVMTLGKLLGVSR